MRGPGFPLSPRRSRLVKRAPRFVHSFAMRVICTELGAHWPSFCCSPLSLSLECLIVGHCCPRAREPYRVWAMQTDLFVNNAIQRAARVQFAEFCGLLHGGLICLVQMTIAVGSRVCLQARALCFECVCAWIAIVTRTFVWLISDDWSSARFSG